MLFKFVYIVCITAICVVSVSVTRHSRYSPYNPRRSLRQRKMASPGPFNQKANQSFENLLSTALSLSSDNIDWDINSLNNLKSVSQSVRSHFDEYRHMQPIFIWNSLKSVCSPGVFIKEFNREYGSSNDIYMQYFLISRELHLNLDHIVRLSDENFDVCIRHIMKYERSIFVENIWYHINDENIALNAKFMILTNTWGSSTTHYPIFVFPDQFWIEEYEIRLKSRSQYGSFYLVTSNYDNVGPVFKTMMALKYFDIAKIAQLKHHWAAFSIPSIEGFAVKFENAFKISMNWAIPRFQWLQLPQVLRQNIKLYVPLPTVHYNYGTLTMIDIIFKLPSVKRKEPVMVTWTFGSPHLFTAKRKFFEILRKLKELGSDNSRIFQLSIPKSAFLNAQVKEYNGVKYYFPPQDLLDTLFDDIFPHGTGFSTSYCSYSSSKKEFFPSNTESIVPLEFDNVFSLDIYS